MVTSRGSCLLVLGLLLLLSGFCTCGRPQAGAEAAKPHLADGLWTWPLLRYFYKVSVFIADVIASATAPARQGADEGDSWSSKHAAWRRALLLAEVGAGGGQTNSSGGSGSGQDEAAAGRGLQAAKDGSGAVGNVVEESSPATEQGRARAPLTEAEVLRYLLWYLGSCGWILLVFGFLYLLYRMHAESAHKGLSSNGKGLPAATRPPPPTPWTPAMRKAEAGVAS